MKPASIIEDELRSLYEAPHPYDGRHHKSPPRREVGGFARHPSLSGKIGASPYYQNLPAKQLLNPWQTSKPDCLIDSDFRAIGNPLNESHSPQLGISALFMGITNPPI